MYLTQLAYLWYLPGRTLMRLRDHPELQADRARTGIFQMVLVERMTTQGNLLVLM